MTETNEITTSAAELAAKWRREKLESQEVTNLLQKAAAEISGLREQNAVMRARLNMFDNVILLLNAKLPVQSEGTTIDVVYELKQLIEKIAIPKP